jgi:L-iditol 2-dehydrogenase
MRAAFGSVPGVIELRDVVGPDPRPGDVVVQVRACGICGSDLHWFQGGLPTPSVCPGHEIAGEVAACGGGVRGVRDGDRVTIEPLVVCRECRACRSGSPQLCPRQRVLGMHRAGGFADAVVAPAYAVFHLPRGLDDFALAALTEPTAVCVHAARLAGVSSGARVLVLGAGTVGLLSVLAARAAGAAEVLISARHPHQAEMARRCGATRVFAATGDGEREQAAYAAEHPIDAVLETVGGTADTVSAALRAVRRGGAVAVLGIFATAPALPALLLVGKEARVIGSLMYDRAGPRADFEVALDLLQARAELAASLITHRVGLEAIQSGFETAADKRNGAIKVSVLP